MSMSLSMSMSLQHKRETNYKRNGERTLKKIWTEIHTSNCATRDMPVLDFHIQLPVSRTLWTRVSSVEYSRVEYICRDMEDRKSVV